MSGTLPAEVKKYAGQGYSIAVTTQGGFAPLTYHWLKGSQAIGTNTAELQFPSLSTGDTGVYTCQVTDDLGSSVTSNASSLQVAGQLSFTQDLPSDVKKYTGENQTFQVATQGGFSPLTYHWTKDSQSVGSNSAAMDIPSVSPSNHGAYSCQINDSYIAALWSSTATLTVADHLSFTTPLPAHVEKHFGEDLALQVVISGGFQPLTYEWYKNDTKVPVPTDSPDLNLSDLSQGDAGTYKVHVADANTDVIQSSTELVLTWCMPVAGLAGLASLAATLALTGAHLRRKR